MRHAVAEGPLTQKLLGAEPRGGCYSRATSRDGGREMTLGQGGSKHVFAFAGVAPQKGVSLVMSQAAQLIRNLSRLLLV